VKENAMLKAIARMQMHILTTSLLLLVGQTAIAETFVCDDGFCVFGPTDVLDNVLVEGDGILLLDGTTVTGYVHVRDGGTLAATRSLFLGNVQAHGAAIVDITISTIEGNFEVKNTGGEGPFGLLPAIDLLGSEVGGNVDIKDNDVHVIGIENNSIEGNVQVRRNQTTLGTTIANNIIGGNLQCKDNSPPAVVVGNVVAGNVDCECDCL
jgi:hypothetical protein